MTLSYCCAFTAPPLMEVLTFLLNPSLFERRSSAASLLRGSEALGSRKRNCTQRQSAYNSSIWHMVPFVGSFCPYLHVTYLQPHNNSVQIQHWLPILPQYVQANIALQVNVWMIDFLRALHLRRIVGEVLIDREVEVKRSTLVHALIRFDRQGEVENIIWVGERGFHRFAECAFKFC